MMVKHNVEAKQSTQRIENREQRTERERKRVSTCGGGPDINAEEVCYAMRTIRERSSGWFPPSLHVQSAKQKTGEDRIIHM